MYGYYSYYYNVYSGDLQMGSTTKRLCDALLNADDIDSYFDNNADRIDIGVDLSEFLEEKLKESGLTRAELFRAKLNKPILWLSASFRPALPRAGYRHSACIGPCP